MEIIKEIEKQQINEIIEIMENNNINKFSFKKSYRNEDYFYLKLLDNEKFIIDERFIYTYQTKYLFDCLFLNYPQTLLFNIFEVDFKRINKKKELLNELKTIGTSNNKLNEFKEMFKN